MKPLNDWELITATLYWRGSCNKVLTAAQRACVWGEGDGYGAMSIEQLRELDLLGDWTHIRDSSPEGRCRVAAAIRGYLGGRGLLTVNRVVNQIGTTTPAEEIAR